MEALEFDLVLQCFPNSVPLGFLLMLLWPRGSSFLAALRFGKTKAVVRFLQMFEIRKPAVYTDVHLQIGSKTKALD